MKHFLLSLMILPCMFAVISCKNPRSKALATGDEPSLGDTVETVEVVTSPEVSDEVEDMWQYEREQFAADYDKIMQAWLDATNANLQTKAPQKFAIVNVDEDGRGELYLRNDDEMIGLLLCRGGGVYTPAMTEFYNDLIRISENRLYVEQFARGGYVEKNGVELNGSWFYTRYFCSDYTEWNPETGQDERKFSYSCDNEEPDAEERSMEFYTKIKEGPAPAALKSVVTWEDISYLKQGIPDPNPDKRHYFDQRGLCVLRIGTPIPQPPVLFGRTLKREMRMGEEATEYPVYVLYNDGVKELEISLVYDYSNENYIDVVQGYTIFSPDYVNYRDNNLRVGSPYDSLPYWIKDKDLVQTYWISMDGYIFDDNISYFIDKNSFTADPDMAGDKLVIDKSTLKSDAAISRISIFTQD